MGLEAVSRKLEANIGEIASDTVASWHNIFQDNYGLDLAQLSRLKLEQVLSIVSATNPDSKIVEDDPHSAYVVIPTGVKDINWQIGQSWTGTSVELVEGDGVRNISLDLSELGGDFSLLEHSQRGTSYLSVSTSTAGTFRIEQSVKVGNWEMEVRRAWRSRRDKRLPVSFTGGISYRADTNPLDPSQKLFPGNVRMYLGYNIVVGAKAANISPNQAISNLERNGLMPSYNFEINEEGQAVFSGPGIRGEALSIDLSISPAQALAQFDLRQLSDIQR